MTRVRNNENSTTGINWLKKKLKTVLIIGEGAQRA
jgi:hypothetical protein